MKSSPIQFSRSEKQTALFSSDTRTSLKEQTKKFLNNPIVEVMSTLLVLLSSLLVAIGTIPSLPSEIARLNNWLEDTIAAIFAIDFFARWYFVGEGKAKYLANPFSVIDIVVVILPLCLQILPSFDFLPSISTLSSLVNLRLLRILRLQRVLKDIETFGNFQKALGLKQRDVRPYQLQLARVVLSIFTLLSVASGLIYTAEHGVNPDIPDYFTALYFGLTTLTTVGFGDIAPITFQGRLVVCGSILAGVAVVPIQTASLVEALLDFQQERQAQKEQKQQKQPTGNLNEIHYDNDETEEFSVDARKSCVQCGAKSHRVDALFCWNCGENLRIKDIPDQNTLEISDSSEFPCYVEENSSQNIPSLDESDTNHKSYYF